MRRLDVLILKAFFGPFFLTTVVATFILLIQYMLKYFDDFVGKDLGFSVFAELIFYFSLNMLQVALPLGVLVSSLMTFGNLGEHFELTAIKSAGISLLRALRPIFIFVIFLSFWAFWFNNTIVPAANLKAYSLLYDIKNKKPALDIKAGVFYNGIPNYSIKAREKLSDNKTLLDIMIYDHTDRDGNRRVILADSSLMYTIYNEKFLKLELFNGSYFIEQNVPKKRVDQFFRTKFSKMDIVFPLSSFDLKRTKEELFRNNRQMKNVAELTADIDSLQIEISAIKQKVIQSAYGYMPYHLKKYSNVAQENDEDKKQIRKQNEPENELDIKDADTIQIKGKIQNASFLSIFNALLEQNPIESSEDTLNIRKNALKDSIDGIVSNLKNKIDTMGLIKFKNKSGFDSTLTNSINERYENVNRRAVVINNALRQARNLKVNLNSQEQRVKNLIYEQNRYTIEKYKKYSQAFACIVMFLIGAPLGAIIKKGGLGVPVIISIFFFIIYYVLTITSEKWAKADLVQGEYAVWTADVILLPVGLFFLRQARIDARLFDTDFYLVVWDKAKTYWKNRSKSK